MKASEFATELKNEVVQLTIDGQKQIECKNLTKYLEEKIPKLDAAEAHEEQVTTDFRLAHYQAQLESDSRMFASVLDYGKHALNAVMLINAGASVALLSLIGSLTTATTPDAGSEFARPLLYFVLGVVCSALASGGSYCTQFFYAERTDQTVGKRFHIATVIFVISSYGLFIAGAFACYLRLAR